MKKCIATKKNGDICTYNTKDNGDYCGVHAEKLECVVCFEKLRGVDKEWPLPCGHSFHRDCIRTWMKENPSCPVCRKNIPVDPEDHEIMDALDEKQHQIELQQIEDDEELARMLQQEERGGGGGGGGEIYLLEPNRFLLQIINNLEDDAMNRLFTSLGFTIDQ